jgi:hypothetical protein
MPFMFTRYAAIFCGVALLAALLADIVQFVAFVLLARISSSGGFGLFATRRGWLAIFAVWWIVSFLIALPLARKFNGLPFSLL